MSTHPSRPFPTTPLARLTGHSGPVHAVTFSAGSGQYILTGSQDRQIRLFNPVSSKLIQTYSAHGYEVLDLAVSADNARFASGGGDKTVFVWDVASARTVRRFVGHVGRVESVAFGGEGDAVVVSGSFDGTVRLWDTRGGGGGGGGGGKAVMVLGEAKDAVSCVKVRGAEIFAGSVDGRVRVYDLAMGRVEVDCLGTAGVTSVMPTLLGDCCLVSTLDSTLRLMDRPTGKCLQTFRAAEFRNETYRVRSTLGMADAVVISGGEDGRVFVWDVLSGEVLHRLRHRKDDGDGAGKGEVVSAVAWNQMRMQWASAGGDGEVVVWGMGD
ncbi:hypothetical protein LTR08_004774 [Meristemomyces frigidus]|nr:hypothetical protein LTR08_004774 [Meristemomyces frigidus]